MQVKAEGWTGRKRSQSTDTTRRNAPNKSVSSTLTALTALNRKAAESPKHRFKDLYRILDLQALYERLLTAEEETRHPEWIT